MSESTESGTAAAELRSTTKWIVAGAIALGSALIALLPSLFPTGRDLSTERVLIVVAGAGAATISLVAIVFASSRVLGPRPTTVRDLVHYLDDRSKKRATRELVNDLNRSRLELLPADVASVRRFWEAMFRKSLPPEELSSHASLVIRYADDELTAHYFRSLMGYLGLFGPLAALGVFAATAALTTAPNQLNLEWRDTPILGEVHVPSEVVPVDCDSSATIEGAIVAVSSQDSRYLFVSDSKPDCPSFGVVLDATESAPDLSGGGPLEGGPND